MGSGTISSGYYIFDSSASTCYIGTGTGQVQSDSVCCVVEGTLIATSPSSSVAVETLAISDQVLSKDIDSFDDDMTVEEVIAWSGSNITGSASNALVTANTALSSSALLNFNNGTLRTTKSHTHIVKRGSQWLTQAASDVAVGDYFENISGALVEITTITEETGSFTVYPLNVETDDVYYAGGILTHNIK